MKTATLLIATLAAAGFASKADAQFAQIGHPFSQSVSDSMYDYDLYIAEPSTATGWYIEWTYPDGTTFRSYAFATEEKADSHIDYLMWHGFDPRGGYMQSGNVPSPRVFSAPKNPDWMFFARYGTRAEAEDAAEWFESFGLLTSISRVSVLQMRVTR